MCAIVGAIVSLKTQDELDLANHILKYIWDFSHERGSDGRGFMVNSSAETGPEFRHDTTRQEVDWDRLDAPSFNQLCESATAIGNLRAEPTTEFVLQKEWTDQQPYTVGPWNIVHNGTIANDKELRTHRHPTKIDSAAIVEQLVECGQTLAEFLDSMLKLKGSYAILASNSQSTARLFAAANYRPIWYAVTSIGTFFASSRYYFPKELTPVMLPPYTVARFSRHGILERRSLRPVMGMGNDALVVCSGGLDSVVSAAYAQKSLGYNIHLIHFLYGSRAEGPEVKAVQAVAKALGCPITLFPLPVYQKGDSPLLDPDSTVAGGEEGAEFAHEWVPARNLLLLSVATAFAEARGMSTIVLGNNLEEAGAYPDNEPEFIERFNDMLPFAVGDGKRMRVIMPVGNMMKHEIVKLGHGIEAPMHLTWSCYRAGEFHCGTCGPCFMRRKAFEINDLEEVIAYKE